MTTAISSHSVMFTIAITTFVILACIWLFVLIGLECFQSSYPDIPQSHQRANVYGCAQYLTVAIVVFAGSVMALVAFVRVVKFVWALDS
jgi:hypothetical protein